MKILKIREGKMKLSLDAQEASTAGLRQGQVISNKDLCTIVRHLLRGYSECDGWGNFQVEAYARIDGSYDIFVMGETRMAKPEENNTRKRCYYGFMTAEHLAFALYVLSKQKPSSPILCEEVSPLIPQEPTPMNVVEISSLFSGEPSLADEVRTFFISSEPKNESREGDRLLRKLPPVAIYRMEPMPPDHQGFLYILATEESESVGTSACFSLCEFGKELTTVTEELLAEHTRKITPEELLV